MDKNDLEKFLLLARTKTYAAATGKAESILPGSVQYEYSSGEFVYRDVYFIGNGKFPGLETIYYRGNPVWSMSYFGNFSKLTEEQVDTMLRKALMDSWETTRLYNEIEKSYDGFKYICEGYGSIEELGGSEEIHVGKDKVYYFYYAGGFIG